MTFVRNGDDHKLRPLNRVPIGLALDLPVPDFRFERLYHSPCLFPIPGADDDFDPGRGSSRAEPSPGSASKPRTSTTGISPRFPIASSAAAASSSATAATEALS